MTLRLKIKTQKACTLFFITAATFLSFSTYGEKPHPNDKEEQLKVVQMRGCATCHGTRGQGNPAMKGPKLAGQSQEVLSVKLKAYRDGEKQNPTMTMMAYNLTDREIEILTTYFSQFH